MTMVMAMAKGMAQRGYGRPQSFRREAILVEQDIHGTVFGVGKLASIALAMT